MRLSIWPNAAQPWNVIAEEVTALEEAGWDGVYVADHFMPNAGTGAADDPVLECGSMVTALGALVDRVRIGSLVFGNTYRHPAMLANIAATVDQVSGGRFTLGVGAGWQVNEHEQYGITLPPVGERVERFAEALEVIAGLLRRPTTTFAGKHYTLTDALCEPKPVQDPLPILVGAGGDRMLRLVARHADAWNTWGVPDHIAERSATLTRACEAAGRDPGAVARSAQALVFFVDDDEAADRLVERVPRAAIAGRPERLRDVMAAYAEAGLDEFIVPDFTLGSGPAKLEALDRFIGEVAPAFR